MALRITRADDEAEVRMLFEDWATATRAKDIDGIVGSCAPDIVAFDCHSQLRLVGTEALRRHLEACLPCMQGPMIFEIHDLAVAAEDDLAFCSYLARCGGTGPDGQEHVGWLRGTCCLRRTEDRWRIVHEHLSAPFDPASGQASLALEP